MKYTVYKLIELVWVGEKFEAQVIYVGITKTSLNRRLQRHIGHANQGRTSRINTRIREILASGQRWKLKIFEIERTESVERESYWINYYRESCDTLLNQYSGCGKYNTFCNQGHELTPDNVYTYPDGRTDCRECRNISVQEHRAKYGRKQK